MTLLTFLATDYASYDIISSHQITNLLIYIKVKFWHTQCNRPV
jgi:hypothetical protein